MYAMGILVVVSCDGYNLIGSANIPAGATVQSSQTLFPRAGDAIHPVLRY